MLVRTFQLLLVACLATGAASEAKDPFVGKWKVNASRSTPTDQMKIAAAGPNRYAITFIPGALETIVADGSDQPGMRGTTLSIGATGPNRWRVIRRKDSRTLITANWTISGDGKTLTDAYTEYHPDGVILNQHYVYERTAGSSGIAGTWVSVSEGANAVIELQIQPYGSNGLSIKSPAAQITRNVKFDGNDYPDVGPNVAPGAVSSGRRLNERSLEITDKFQDKITGTQTIELSKDLKTLTMTVRLAGQSKPAGVMVLDRE
jgi:hypothetical protein